MTAEAMNKRQQQRQKRREEILDCALDLIISRGYEAMKIRDIADRLGISVGLFFNYFESKEQVYEELVKIGIMGPQSVIQMNTQNIDPLEMFESMTSMIFQSLQSYSMTARMFLLMSQTMKSEALPDGVKKIVQVFDAYTPLLPVIQKGQEMGKIKQGDPVALIVAYWGAVQGIASSYAIQPNLPLPESSWVVDILRA